MHILRGQLVTFTVADGSGLCNDIDMNTQTLLASIVSGFLILAPVAMADDAAQPAAEKTAQVKHTHCECGDCKKGHCAKKHCEHCEHKTEKTKDADAKKTES